MNCMSNKIESLNVIKCLGIVIALTSLVSAVMLLPVAFNLIK